MMSGALRRSDRWIALIVFAVAFFYQWPRTAFTNDHFESLAKAQQLLRGELPIRDFFDNGRPLTLAIAAAGLKASGGTLVGEALITMSAISAGVALLFMLTRQLTSSWLLAGWAALCLMTLEPRLYNYGKVILALGGVAVAYRYIDRPGSRRAAALGMLCAIAFLWRHDFGIYLAVLAAVTFAPRLFARPREGSRDVAVALIVAMVLVVPYLAYLWTVGAFQAVAGSGGEAFLTAAQLTWRPLSLTTSPEGTPLRRYLGETWIYDLFVIAPVAAIGVLFYARRTAGAREHKIAATAALCLMLVLFLIRGNLDSRLADVAGPSLLLLAWLLSVGRGPARRVAGFAIAVVTLGAIVGLAGNPVRRLFDYARDLPGSVTRPWAALHDPIGWWEGDGLTDTRALARWLRECTRPDDRVLVFGYYPEVVFFSQRSFAGGQAFLHSGYYSSPAEQDLTVARLQHQHVPFIVIERSDLPALDGTYLRIGNYVRNHFTAVVTSDFRGPHAFTILQRNDVTAPLRDDGLPCSR
jgi:hypothetical protein